MKRLIILITWLLYTTVATAQIHPAYQGLFQHTLDSICERLNVKGASAAILIPGSGTWTGAYGESHEGVPITTDMYIPIGSNTKTFTASLILKLQENGQLSIDDTIGKWFPGLENVDGQITIKQMLNHTSGLYNYTNNAKFFKRLNDDYEKIWEPEDMLDCIDKPYFKPGASWEYSNTNYLLAGLIIKKILNEPFHESVRKMILTPNGLNHTVTFPGEQPSGTVPHGWSNGASGKELEDMMEDYGWSNNCFLSMANAAGAIMSTAEDNVHFWNALMTGKVINNNSFAQMKTFVKMGLGPYRAYGLGLARALCNKRGVIAHRGTCFGYVNENLVDTVSGVCITVLSNDDSVGNDVLYYKLVTALHKITVDMPPASVAGIGSNHQNVIVYPNPASNAFTIKAESIDLNRFELIDMTGKVLLYDVIKNKEAAISLNNVPAGLFIVRVYGDDGEVFVQKLQVVK